MSSLPTSALYHCSCSSTSTPSYTSSHDLKRLETLYFCDECDAIRCDDCVDIQVASYFCPGCLFEVANASVKADQARCARNCFQCPICPTRLTIEPSDLPRSTSSCLPSSSLPSSSSSPSSVPSEITTEQRTMGTTPYIMNCNACGWSSDGLISKDGKKEWVFEKANGIAQYSLSQASSTPSRKIYDSLLTHYDTHLSLMTSQSSSSSDQPKSHSPTNLHNPPQTLSKPTRMINQVSLSQSQSQRQRSPNKTSNKHTHGNRVTSSTFLKRPVDRVSWRKKPVFLEKKLGELEDDGWDWGREEGLVSSENQLERKQARGDEVGHVGLKQVWEKAWDGLDDGGVGPWNSSNLLPSRLPLLSKQTKRCPSCSHTLIRPDPKPTSVRFKIKIMGSQYLPGVEVVRGELEEGGGILNQGGFYSCQLAFTNPLLDHISMTIKPPILPPTQPYTLHFSDFSFPIAAFAEAWELDLEDDLSNVDKSVRGMERQSSRVNIVGAGGGGGGGNEVGRFGGMLKGMERRGNVTKIGLGVEVKRGGRGRVQFDLPIAMTYKVEEEIDPSSGLHLGSATMTSSITGGGSGGGGTGTAGGTNSDIGRSGKVKEVLKVFEFVVRINLGDIVRG